MKAFISKTVQPYLVQNGRESKEKKKLLIKKLDIVLDKIEDSKRNKSNIRNKGFIYIFCIDCMDSVSKRKASFLSNNKIFLSLGSNHQIKLGLPKSLIYTVAVLS